jgi:hypothetical protein
MKALDKWCALAANKSLHRTFDPLPILLPQKQVLPQMQVNSGVSGDRKSEIWEEGMAEISFFGNVIRGDYFLVLALITVIAGTFSITALLRRGRRNRPVNSELERLLSKPEVLAALGSGNDGLAQLLKHLENQRPPEQESLMTITSRKIINDIQWDVAGLIGVAVTVVLLFMVVSGTVSQAPEQIFTGWLLILGYYFGKGSRQ